MFEGKGFFEILSMGGWTLYTLFFISIVSISIIALKIYEFKLKSIKNIDELLLKVKVLVKKKETYGAIEYCKSINKPVSNVIVAGLKRFLESSTSNIEEAMKRAISVEVVELEKYTTFIATIGAVSVYIGLFGTVLGIIRSFHDISLAGSGGISVVIGGVSESLIATAAGLCVAIPAVVAYNFFTRTIDKYVVDMEYALSALRETIESVLNNE